MTTPESFRRWQLIEGVVLILLAIFTVLQGVLFSLERRDTQDCIETKFRELSVTLDRRAELAMEESAATKEVMLRAAAGAQAKNPRELEQVRERLRQALLDYEETIDRVQEKRAKNPVPPYPVGVCES